MLLKQKPDNERAKIAGVSGELCIGLSIAESCWQMMLTFSQDDHRGGYLRFLKASELTGGKHKVGSLHPKGRAADLQTNGLGSADLAFFVARLKEQLGPDWDVLFEGDHVHIEFDPK